jgi:uncharacterized protein YjiS (DUF1127 family)
MLYRTRRPSVLRAALARLAGALGEFHRTGADTAYLDGLSAHQLRDLGIRRFTDRDETYYRS